MSFSTVPIGEKYPNIVNAVVEIPRGSHHKYEYDERLDQIKLDRVLNSPVFYPADYGFIPKTRSEDGDHLDVLVLISEPVFPGCVLSVRPIGLLNMNDDAGQDWKILAVADKDPKLSTLNDIGDVDVHYRNEIVHFFEVYKHLENKHVEVVGWLDKNEAFRVIKESAKRFNQK